MKKIFALSFALATLLGTSGVAQAATSTKPIARPVKQEQREVRKENLKDLRDKVLARASDRFTDFYARMEKLGVQVEQIINKVAASASADQALVTKAKTALDAYKAKLLIAKDKVAIFVTASNAPAGNATGTIASEINTKRKEARAALADAHKALKDTVSATREAIKSAKPVRPTTATTTATSTVN